MCPGTLLDREIVKSIVNLPCVLYLLRRNVYWFKDVKGNYKSVHDDTVISYVYHSEISMWSQGGENYLRESMASGEGIRQLTG